MIIWICRKIFVYCGIIQTTCKSTICSTSLSYSRMNYLAEDILNSAFGLTAIRFALTVGILIRFIGIKMVRLLNVRLVCDSFR